VDVGVDHGVVEPLPNFSRRGNFSGDEAVSHDRTLLEKREALSRKTDTARATLLLVQQLADNLPCFLGSTRGKGTILPLL
jgi:hypothetical protein